MTKFILSALSYLPWTIVSLLSGVVYIRLLLGPNPVPQRGLWGVLHMFFKLGMLRVGFIFGAVLALAFILADVFYLRQKLGHGLQATALRVLCFICIGICVAIIHYVLEKVVDVI
ncbi:MAG: hypothetical protein L3J65_03435 [Robiginitomaculum sp.]|nr:hypothetical protein [Robiginitomaculum sp.]